MSKMSKIVRIIKRPIELIPALGNRGFLKWMSDEQYLKLVYRARIGHPLDLKNPTSFNAKLQWLKIHDHNPLYTKLVDKYEVKQWVADRIGQEYVIPTLGVWDNFDQIDFDLLPDRFVLKCTHDSGGVSVCADKSSFDLSKARDRINRSKNRNFYYVGREWPYKDVKSRIIAEEFIDDGTGDLIDYKFLCCDGEVRCAFTCSNRAADDLRVDFFDLDWNLLPFTRHYPNSDIPCNPPKSLLKMKAFSEELSRDIPFVRVDFYEIDAKPFFGEMTFYPGSGCEEFDPEYWDEKLGSWINLPSDC